MNTNHNQETTPAHSFLEAAPGAEVRDYPHALVFRNPEGNRVHRDMYKTKEHADAAAEKWGDPREGFCTDYWHFPTSDTADIRIEKAPTEVYWVRFDTPSNRFSAPCSTEALARKEIVYGLTSKAEYDAGKARAEAFA